MTSMLIDTDTSTTSKKASPHKDQTLPQNLATQISKINLEHEGQFITINSFLTPGFFSPKPKQISFETFYPKEEVKNLIKVYGSDVYNFSFSLSEQQKVKRNYLDRHPLHNSIRTKMVDWMIEVFYAYKSDPSTFFMAIDLMDRYLAASSKKIGDGDIHLLGVVCIFIASKMEDIAPLRMSHIIHTISHNKFTERQIRKKEKEILTVLDFKLVITSSYELIGTIIADLEVNNASEISELKSEKYIKRLKKIAVFLAKMITLSEEFSSKTSSEKSLACLIVAFDLLRSESPLELSVVVFLNQWITFLIASSPYSCTVTETYRDIKAMYANFEKIRQENVEQWNINKDFGNTFD